jgi:hypothetical protein
MQRLCYVGTVLAACAILAAPLFAQDSASNRARVERVVVRGSDAAMEVEIQTYGAPVAPDTQAIAAPDRIVVDFPGATPSAALRALKVNRGALKGIRAGLFFDNPPITRIVLDLAEPQSYRISTAENAIVVKLGPAKLNPAKPDRAAAAFKVPAMHAVKLQNAALATAIADSNETQPPKQLVAVSFENGMLRIRADKATLAQVLFEVQRQTQADIAIPAGAELEPVVADLGPAPAREVLASLLNGSSYNFIFVGDELTLERVILTRRDSSSF